MNPVRKDFSNGTGLSNGVKKMLEIRNLTCGYDAKFILQDINFTIEEKEFVGIIGPNGSGKTTLLRAITKIIRPQNGSIIFEGKDLESLNFRELAKRIASVTQNWETDLKMTVEEFVLLGRIPHLKKWQFLETNVDEEIAKESMSLTDTFKFKDRPLESLSAGERQLVVTARALTQEPKLLLLDEPTSHLDIAHQVQILDLIKRLNKKNGLTVMIVLHDLNLASEYCERLVLLNNGLIHKIGKPEEVLTYSIIEEVYNTIVVVEKNPISFRPYILLVPEEERQSDRQRKSL